MDILTEPKPRGGGPHRVALALVIALAVAGVAIGLLARRPAKTPGPAAPPRARSSPSPRVTPFAVLGEARDSRLPAEAHAAAPAPRLRVVADVPGATVFLDRKYLGTSPVETSAFEPGSHRLNVSAEGYEMYAESVELAAGPNEVVVRFKQVRLDSRIAVTHKHGIGSCRGVLQATTAGLRFEADKAGDSFQAAFSTLEPLHVDYLAKNLRVKQKGNKTWNFTGDNADALLVFQKEVEGARARL